MDKFIIRQTILRQRSKLSLLRKSQAESVMLESLLNWKVFQQAKAIHIFISNLKEPATRPIINHCWNAGKIVAVPIVLPNKLDLVHSEIKSFDDLIYGLFGIQEPPKERRIPMTPDIFDLVIVPGVAFDRKGGRLGHGMGYYDRFLKLTSAYILALTFDCQIIESVPTETHDIPMNAILSESGIIEIKV